MTQKELAEKLNISDKAVSKWETGKGLPEVGLMLPLCQLLHINVNELLSGKRLDEKQYYKKAEENIMDLLQERTETKKKIVMSVIIVLITMLAGLTLIVLSALLEMEIWLRIVLIVIAILVIGVGIGLACISLTETQAHTNAPIAEKVYADNNILYFRRAYSYKKAIEMSAILQKTQKSTLPPISPPNLLPPTPGAWC